MKRTLGFVLDRPTPIKYKKKEYKHSILKQCLLFNAENAPARVTVYKIAEHLELYLSSYIDCIDDLALILESIPAQQFRPVINKLEENITTKYIQESIMSREGEEAKMRVECEDSNVAIDDNN